MFYNQETTDTVDHKVNYRNINKQLSFKEAMAFNGFINQPLNVHFEDTKSEINFLGEEYTLPGSFIGKSLNDIVSGMTEAQRKNKIMQDITILSRKIDNVEKQILVSKDGNQLSRLQSDLNKYQNEIIQFEFNTDLKEMKKLTYTYEESAHLSLIKAYLANRILIIRNQEILVDPDNSLDEINILEYLFEDFVVSSKIDSSFLSLRRAKE